MSEMQLHDIPSDVSPSTSRIELWRRSIEPVSPPSPLPEHHTLKHKRQALYDTDPAPAKRITRRWRGNNPLQPISGNMTSPNRKLSLRQTPQKTPSQSKKQARQQTNGGVHSPDDEYEEATPRRERGRGLGVIPVLSANGGGGDPSNASSSTGPSADTSSTGRSSTPSREGSRRSSSPVKKKIQMGRAEVPTFFCVLDGTLAAEAGGVLTDYGALIDASRGKGVIPGSLQSSVESSHLIHELDHPYQFSYITGDEPEQDQSIWSKVIEIYENAKHCEQEYEPEVEWNSQVHGPLLRLVVEDPKYERGVICKNITAARIKPHKLAMFSTGGDPMSKKMVDFGLTLNLQTDQNLKQRIRRTMTGLHHASQSLNQSDHAALQYAPIFLNVETKLPFTGGEEAEIQLGVWTSAGFNKVELLLRWNSKGDQAVPMMPGLLVYGHDWFLCAMQRTGGETLTYGKLRLGGTDSILGIFQILRALDILVTWGSTEYREWYLDNVLK